MAIRTMKISTQYDPSISGYGGYDEWTLDNLTSEQIDYINERIQKLVDGCVKSFKTTGGWTGVC